MACRNLSGMTCKVIVHSTSWYQSLINSLVTGNRFYEHPNPNGECLRSEIMAIRSEHVVAIQVVDQNDSLNTKSNTMICPSIL